MVKGQAVWKESWYQRKGKGSGGNTWRNRYSGEISRTPEGLVIGLEPTNANPYGLHQRSKKSAMEDIERFKKTKR